MSMSTPAPSLEAVNTNLFKNKPFLLQISAQAVSNIGDWLNIVALYVLVGVRFHGTPLEVALVLLSMAGPMTLLGPFTGMVADRLERKTLMIVSSFVSACLVVMFPFVHHLWEVYPVVCLLATVDSFFTPAENGKLKEIVADAQMQRAVSIRTIVNNGAKILGPSLSGALVAAFGANMAFYINSATFIVAAVLLLPLPRGNWRVLPEDAASDSRDASDIKSGGWALRFREGITHVRTIRWLLVGMLLFTVILLVLQLIDSQFIVLFRQVPHVPIQMMGFTMAASGVGMITSAVLTGRKKWTSVTRIMAIGSFGVGFGYGIGVVGILLHLSIAAALFIPCGFVIGGSFGLVLIPFQAAAQEATPVHLTGRVFGVIDSLANGASLLGPLAGGIIATFVGILPTAILSSSLLVVIGLTVLCLKQLIEPEGSHVAEGHAGVQGTTPQ